MSQPNLSGSDNRAGARVGLAVFAFLLIVAFAIAYGLKNKYGPEMSQTQDLVTGLLYYMEQHAGRFPASEQEFLASRFIERLPDGAIRIKPTEQTRFRKPHGIAIRELKRFEIAWGADLSAIVVDDRGKPRDADGKPIALITWPSSPPSGASYTVFLLQERAKMVAAASAPATQP